MDKLLPNRNKTPSETSLETPVSLIYSEDFVEILS